MREPPDPSKPPPLQPGTLPGDKTGVWSLQTRDRKAKWTGIAIGLLLAAVLAYVTWRSSR